jgi:hypothetical protein
VDTIEPCTGVNVAARLPIRRQTAAKFEQNIRDLDRVLRLNKLKAEGGEKNDNPHNMKKLLALISLAGLFGCAEEPQQVTVANTHYPYSRYSTTTEVWGHPNPAYVTWTTGALQKRRLDLYGTVPQGQDRHGVPFYIYQGIPLRQQDEIKAIEVELNRRYQAGDKSAKLEEWWPQSRRHSPAAPNQF